jgi:hypothetical protein
MALSAASSEIRADGAGELGAVPGSNKLKIEFFPAGRRVQSAKRPAGQPAHGVAQSNGDLYAAGDRNLPQERELEFVGVRVGVCGPALHD